MAYPAFTLDQLSMLLAWGNAGPPGLSLGIVAGQTEFSEVAVVSRHDGVREHYLAYPTAHGTVVLIRHPGARWELPTVEAVLAKILLLEQGNVDA